MKFMALRPLKLKTPTGPKVFKPGEVFTPKDPAKALELARLGLMKPLDGPKPYLTPQGDLVIPFDSDSRYWWWAGGQSVMDTIKELSVPLEVMRRYGTY